MEADRLPRHWLLIARRGEGKSTFASTLSPEYLVADLDGRWEEQKKRINGNKSHVITEPDPLRLAARMEEMRVQLADYVRTIVFDSGTAVLDYMGAKGRLSEAAAKAANKKYNGDDANKLKADTLRLLRFAALRWHCDVLWIFHTEDNMKSGAKGERTTISALEMERMKANLNAVLTIVKDSKGKRGIRIEWSRYNNNVAAGQTIWDDQGMWVGIPEKLDDFIAHYAGTEGFNGNVYGGEWLLKYLASKDVAFADMEDMFTKLDIREEPAWFDRKGWGALVEKAAKK